MREAKEETGYDVQLGGELKVQPDEILDANWFSFDEITEMKQDGKLRVDWIYDAMSRVELQPAASRTRSGKYNDNLSMEA